MDLTDKVALITGATRGIGRGVALALAGAGANLVVNYKHDRDDSDRLVKEIRCVLFLASEDSRYITGQTVHVSGGLVIP